VPGQPGALRIGAVFGHRITNNQESSEDFEMNTPHARTDVEVRRKFLLHIKEIVRYWSKQPDITARDACDGVAFSILNIFDGCTFELPAMDIKLRSHEDDKQFHIDCNKNWYEPGMTINKTMLHEEYCTMDE